MKEIKLVVLDFDGTILRDDKTIDRGLAEVMLNLKKRGVLVTFATGRNIYSTMDLARRLPFELPFAINNGAMIYAADGRVLASWTIPTHLNNRLLQTMFEREHAFLAYADEAVIFNGFNPVLNKFREFLAQKLATIAYDADSDYSHLHFYKILLDAEDTSSFEHFKALVRDKYPSVSLAANEGSLFVITSPEATKGNALKRLCQELQVNLVDCMAIGDNHNDRTMLEESGLAVAMSNSELPILAMADIVIGSNNEDGVSTFLTKYFSL